MKKFTEIRTNSTNGVVCCLQKKVEDKEQSHGRDLCDQCEHLECVWSVDRPSKVMHEVLTEDRSKAILYVCSCCYKQGSVSKHLEMEDEHA